MKRIKSYLLLSMCVLAATAFTSCLDDDDNNNFSESISQTDRDNAIEAASGVYDGKLYFDNPDNADGKDSIDINWNISQFDSLFSCAKFPVKVLAKFITDKDHKAVLEKAEDQLLWSYIHLYSKINVYGSYLYTFVTNPVKISDFTVDGTHNVSISFLTEHQVGSGQSFFPISQYYKKLYGANLLFGNVIIDGKTYPVNKLFSIRGTKK